MKNKAKFPIPTLIPALTMDRKLAHPWRPPASVVEGDDALLKSLKIFLTFSGLNSRTKVLGIIPRIRNITKITDYKDKRFTFHLWNLLQKMLVDSFGDKGIVSPLFPHWFSASHHPSGRTDKILTISPSFSSKSPSCEKRLQIRMTRVRDDEIVPERCETSKSDYIGEYQFTLENHSGDLFRVEVIDGPTSAKSNW